MTEQIEYDKETIALLRKENKAKDNELYLAATFGNQLLEENKQIQKKLEKAQSQLEIFEQEKYTLQLDLDAKVQIVQTQDSELETQTVLVDDLKKRMQILETEAKVLKQRFNELSREKCDLEKSHEDLQLENSSLKNKMQLLEQQIENYQNATILCGNDTTIEEEHPDINLYITQNKTLQDTLAEVQYELECVKLKESRLINQVKELEEAVTERDKELQSYSVEIQKAKEFSSELQCEIETLKLGEVDVNRRGNSMFGELDDRRKLVEKEYKLLSNQYDKVLRNYEENKAELTRCKSHMTILLSMTSKKYQENYIEKLENMLSVSRRNVEILSDKLTKAMKNNQQQNIGPSESDKYDYLRVLNKQAEKKIKELENDLITLRMQIVITENSLADSNSDLYKCKQEFNELKIENLKLQQRIKELTSKPDSDAPVKKKPVIEILPGFESNAETRKRYEMLTNENVNRIEDDFIPGELMLGEDGFKETKPPRLSHRTVLRNFNSDQKNNSLKSHEIPARSSLKDISSITEHIPLMPVNHNGDDFPTGNKRSVNCAQQ